MRATLLIAAAAMSGSGLLLAGCSAGANSASSSVQPESAPGIATKGGAGSSDTGTAAGAAQAQEPGASSTAASGAGASARSPAADGARLLRAQSIIYTATLTIRAHDVQAAAAQATSIATAARGYVASEQDSLSQRPGLSSITVQLKVPVAGYLGSLRQLSGQLGKQLSLSQQAQDVTGEVADVSSRVTSAQVAITQLRALLRRAGSISGLLSVQDEINSQESSLESLQSQQRALASETSYATITVRLLSQHKAVVHHHAKKHHGFAAGLSDGWHGLRAATSWLLTAAGTVLPFAAVLAVLGGAGWFGWRRIKLRRRSRPAPAA